MSRLRTLFLFPTAVWMFLLLLAPTLIVCAYSLLTRGTYGGVGAPWTIENYQRLADPLYLSLLLRSIVLASIATAICLGLGFPIALFISRAGKRKHFYLSLVILPFWTSFLVRTYAWMFLLRDTGLVNTVLQALGIVREPLPLLYNDGAVILGLVYGYVPFMVLPIFATLERVDHSLIEASADLGARPLRTVTSIVLPLAKPGIIAGTILVFIPCLGAYLTPDLLGGGKSAMIGNLIQNQFTNSRDWAFGSAASLFVMAIVLVLVVAVLRKEGDTLL